MRSWWNKPHAEMTPDQLEARRRYDREWKREARKDPAKKAKDRAVYHRCINKDREKFYARNAAWRKANWPAVLAARRKPNYRIASQMRSRIRAAIKTQKGIKSKAMLALLGCTIAELMVHLERRFRDGMTWDNYGPHWHIDHIKPCSSFDLTEPNEQAICFHFTNLQPLPAKENLKKAARLG